MIKIKLETRNKIADMVIAHPEGLTLDAVHDLVRKECSRLQARTSLDALYLNAEITRKREKRNGRSETYYYPYDGTPPKKRKNKVKVQGKEDKDILKMKDFNDIYIFA